MSIEEHRETASSTVKENVEDTVTSSRGEKRGAEELGLLTDLYAFYNKYQHYQFTDDMQEFYNRQVKVYRAYANDEDVDKKLCELYENYMKVMENKVEFPTDPIDIEIIRHSSWIWGNEKFPNDVNEKPVDYGGVDPKHSSKQETGDDDMKDSSKKETGDDNLKDPKRLMKQETGDIDMKDSEDFTKETDDDQGGITGHDWKKSPGNEGGASAS
ncbi:hypothetical protein L2E82_41450 [Cichorium intybus]|uniref:Uncharacterized protein n=1 Tax=Cichorium intybus TaxID=13427 RepID=A0ACB9AMF9_CICIN|nr:hypothetical protein L2E82_41450 [Cichorium intybus]